MQQRQRATFDAAELAVILSHYDLGVIESITEFAKGSRRSAKVGVVSERGKFLLKRVAATRAQPDRVRFAHSLQDRLGKAGFPLAKLVPTSDRGQTMLQVRDRIYELFEFVPGQPYRRTAQEAHDAGVVLARFHEATEPLSSTESVAPAVLRGDFHDAPGVRTGLCTIGSRLNSHDSFTGNEAELADLVQFLLDAFDRAAEAVNDLGLKDEPGRLIHSDWHPGNLLFRHRKVVAVVDYDAVRYSKGIIDVANGVLQFSMVASGEPSTWPEHLDEKRFEGFLSGYESLRPLSEVTRRYIPHLMVEALIAECVHPIAQTGSVGRWTGFRVLQMARRKVAWMIHHREELSRAVGGASHGGGTVYRRSR